MIPPRSAFGASPPGGRHQRPGKAGSAVALVLACCAALVGCAGGFVASSSVPSGTSRADVIARLGQPTRSVALPSGERLQYSQQPMGQYATMVDLDRAGRVVSARQVLTLAEFSRIVDGQWTRADVEREFGPPARVDGVASWRGDILTYRWNDGSDMFFFVYLDANQVVQRAHPGMEFVNAPDRE